MKKLTLDETWRLCLSMWRWIAKVIKAGDERSVMVLKEVWLDNHGFPSDGTICGDCFFCEYDDNKEKTTTEQCCYCPGRKIDEDFNCCDKEYHYGNKSIAFYNKLVQLNRKRLKVKK